MKTLDREALRWARYLSTLSTRKQPAWVVVAFLVASVCTLAAALWKGDAGVAWIAFGFLFLSWGQFERRGFVLLAQNPETSESERRGAPVFFGVLFPALAIVIWLSIKSLTSR
jgi:hypothetical protein